ncbi:MAG TPA: outer membrane beta-barrel protein [Verrucomicrobiae bacterium]|nr:outer membrane beta-barrel protein [Verrucomicrobiae bacterium]
MKKIFVSAGLIAAGTAGLQAVNAPDVGPMQATKPWSISATLRGFYDDNYTTGSGGFGHGSGGFEFSPSFDFNMVLQQTEIGFRYTYGLYYYQDREDKDQNPVDQTHEVDLWIDHAFTERWHGRFQDSLVVGQEPELLDPLRSTPTRVEGNNLANTGTFTVTTDWTRELSTEFGYQNKFYDYENSGGNALDPSLAGELDRVENNLHLDGQWHFSPLTMVFIGYAYGQVNYTADEVIAPGYTSSDRDNLSHYGYVGLSYLIMPNLSLIGKGGFQYTDFYNDPSGTTSFGPYANISLTYTYLPGSYAQLGLTHSRNATDQIQYDSINKSITLDQESTLVYATINHKITPYLLATVIGQLEYSVFNGGALNNSSEVYYGVGVNLSYAINPHLSAEVGYNFDKVNALARTGLSYARDRFYVGVTGTY